MLPCALLSALLWSIPIVASAKQETVMDFRQGVPGQWEKSACLSAQQKPEGVALATTTERCSLFYATRDLRHPIETLSLTVLSPLRTDLLFLWHRRDDPIGYMIEFPLAFSPAETPQTVRLNLPRYRQWDSATDRIGFSLPKGSSIILQNITFTRWSVWDKTVAALRSFWTFDTFRPYSINFLWGPIIGFNPVWQEQLFEHTPPVGWSAARVFLSLLIATSIPCLFFYRRRTAAARRAAALALCGMFAGFWLLFDARMGLELLSYVKADWETFLLQPQGTRSFRIFKNFPDIAAESVPLLTLFPRYGFVGPHGAPFGSLLRYETYPAARPVSPNDPPEQRKLARRWLVAFRDDARISPSGELFLGDTFLAGPGSIVKSFGRDAFIFEVTDSPPPSPRS